MERLLWVCVAGALGSGARYLVALAAAQRFGSAFPFGTLIVNLAGCFAAGVVVQVATAQAWSPTLRTAVVVGFLGGFTTYSSFNQETLRLVQQGDLVRASTNVAATVAGGWIAGLLGLAAARAFVGR